MDRRAFVAAIGGAMTVGASATVAHASERRQHSRRLGLGPSYVTNREQFDDASRFSPGEQLLLRRRTDRSFDRNSIEVLTKEANPIGFLPPVSSAMLASLMDEGHMAYALVDQPAEPGQQVKIDIHLVLST